MKKRNKPNSLSISFLFLLISLCCTKPCMAYEEDTHFLMTYVMLKSVGYTHAEALLIAAVDEGMDDSPGVVAPGGLKTITNLAEEWLWHALDNWGTTLPKTSRPDLIYNRSVELFHTAQMQQDYRNKLICLGVFFHFQQDIWAHRQHYDSLHLIPHGYTTYTTPKGHAFDWKEPDRPPFDPVAALMCLEDGVTYAIQFLREDLHREPYCLFQNFHPAGGRVDTNWVSTKKGYYFNQIYVEPVETHQVHIAPNEFLQALISAQIDAYTSSTSGRYLAKTPDQADFNAVRAALQDVCNANGELIGDFIIPAHPDKEAQGFYTLTTPMLQQPLPEGILVLDNVAYLKHATKSFDINPALGAATLATDGDFYTYSRTTKHVKSWVQVDLGAVYDVLGIELYNVPGNIGPTIGQVTTVFSVNQITPDLWPQAPAPYAVKTNLASADTFATTIFPDTAHQHQYSPRPARYVTVFPDTSINAAFLLPEIKVFGSRAPHVPGQPYTSDEITYITFIDTIGNVRGRLSKVNDLYWLLTFANNQIAPSTFFKYALTDIQSLNMYSYYGRVGITIDLNTRIIMVYEPDNGNRTTQYRVVECGR